MVTYYFGDARSNGGSDFVFGSFLLKHHWMVERDYLDFYSSDSKHLRDLRWWTHSFQSRDW